jgi:glycine hydroxymethyltransferase
MASALTRQGFDLVYHGTDNHLMLLDLRKFNITGKEAEKRLDEVRIHRQQKRHSQRSPEPLYYKRIRIGTPAVTTRGFVEEDCEKVAHLIYLALTDFERQADFIRGDVKKLCDKYPLYR